MIASPEGARDSLVLKQDASLYQVVLPARGQVALPLASNRRGWVHVIDGSPALAGVTLGPGDGAALANLAAPVLGAGDSPVRALVFELP